ncbi:MAG: hypothetical protein CVU51_03655 [Deltaproteobacteria bacterium HGW-Deltaproteobacteria-1]|jgi:hypothetical protein|nr:MAG: hypothetical protein CVU51_03655 [Deltaproteobacteria bacterium HGW-Deltaproteobacteria-1]
MQLDGVFLTASIKTITKWKYSGRGNHENPLKDIIGEAQRMSSDWPPLKAGFFGGDITRFIDVATAFEESIKKLNWW